MEFSNFLEQNRDVLIKEKSDHVFKQGDNHPYLYFIKSGILKAYYLTAEGKEFVKSFLLPGDIIGSLSSMYDSKQCTFSLICLEKCELFRVDLQQYARLSLENKDIAKVVIELLIKLVMKKERREYEFLCLSPEERYNEIRKNSPVLLDKVTQNDIARYLGITPVALSRIRGRLAQKTSNPK